MPAMQPCRIAITLMTLLAAGVATAFDREFEDRDFAPVDWTSHPFPWRQGGTASWTFEEDDGWPGRHLRVRLEANNPLPPDNSGMFFIGINETARHDPAVDGEIFVVNYQEHAIAPRLNHDWARVNLALRQGTNFFVVPEPALFVNEPVWSLMEQNALRANQFTNIMRWFDPVVPEMHPDFSTNGAEIAFGFFRGITTGTNAWNVPPGTPVFHTITGIDNWRVELMLSDPAVANTLPRAGRRVETYAINREHPATSPQAYEAFDRKFEPAPIADVTRYLTADAHVLGSGVAPEMRIAEAEARIGVFAGVRASAQGGITVQTLQPRERRSTATSRDIRHFVARAPHGVTHAEIDLWMLADGFFELRSLILGNPWEPYYDQLTAFAEQRVVLHRQSDTRTIMRGAVRIHRAPGNPSIRIVTQESWQDAVTFQPYGNGTFRRPTLDYSEVMLNVATVPVGEPFALEFRLHAETRAGDEAADWIAVADLYNTAGYHVQTSTPGVEIIEITPVADPRPRLNLVRTDAGLQLDWDASDFILQSAPGIGGAWTDRVGAVSPFLIEPLLPVEIFRLREQAP
jgi:hypothetical protein